MSKELTIRRVVTGHDAEQRAIVAIDEIAPSTAPRPGHQTCVIWANDKVPADNLDAADGALKAEASRLANGATFRIVRHEPGAVSRMHRTQTLDYGVVMSGSIVLELDDGAEVQLQAGDVLVQRGTIHKWTNRGNEPCTMAFVLIDAAPIGRDP